jgi:hypothetical protein
VDYARDAFELLMTDAGKWPRAVERNSDGGYLLMQSAAAWPIWCAAVAFERERCAKLCEGMHDEDRPSDYAWTIRTEWADDSKGPALVDAAVAAERERCAKLCDPTNADRPEDWTEYAKTRAECAARIRGA